jgi:hypothetical protein
VPDKAVISHRGEKYEIGRGKRFYGIWAVGAPYDAPLDRWPENQDGWHQAWARFAVIEVPGTIAAVPKERRALPGGVKLPSPVKLRPRPGNGAALLTGEALLVLGVVLGLAGLFPAYEGGQSLLSQADQVVPHLAYVIGWAVTAALVALSVARPSNAARLGALFGLGLGVVTFGLFLADLGQLSGGVSLGAGLVVSLLGWATCTAGSALALAAHPGSSAPAAQLGPDQAVPAEALPAEALPPQAVQPVQPGWSAQAIRPERASRPVRPRLSHAGPLALLVLAAIGTAAAFAPAWDSYTIASAASGTKQTVTAGNAFDNPGLVIAGNVAVMVAIIAVAAIAALWRPARHGGWLLAGAIVPLAAEAVSAIIQAGTAPSPAMFGVSSAQAAAAGLTFTGGLTGIFWVYLVFVVALLISCAWLFTEPRHPAMPAYASPWLPAGPERDDAKTDDARLAPAVADQDEAADRDVATAGARAAESDSAAARPAAPAGPAEGDPAVARRAAPAASEGDAGVAGPGAEYADGSETRAAGDGESRPADSGTGTGDSTRWEDIDSAAR